MPIKQKEIECCKGEYHVLMDGKYYCLAPPNIKCQQTVKEEGKFTKGEKKIYYCVHHQHPCENCSLVMNKSKDKKDPS